MVVQARSNGWRTVLRAHPYRPTAARGLSSAKSLLLAILQFACPRALSKTSSNCPAEFLSCLKKQSSNFGGAAPSYGSEFSPRRSVLV